MSDKIAEIRDRHSKRTEIDHNGSYRLDGYSYPGTLTQSQRDLETALAEVERQREALKNIAALDPDVPDALVADALRVVVAQMGDLARKALEGKP